MPPVNTCSCAANQRRIFWPSVMPGTSVREKLIDFYVQAIETRFLDASLVTILFTSDIMDIPVHG